MIVYISGPMSGDYRPVFAEAEKKLKSLGLTVINPAAIPTGLRRESHLHIHLALIDACDVVVLLPGWGKEATIEQTYAKHQGKTTVEYEWMTGGRNDKDDCYL